jgi:LPXTG-site transpeptidase (sortase) family protein
MTGSTRTPSRRAFRWAAAVFAGLFAFGSFSAADPAYATPPGSLGTLTVSPATGTDIVTGQARTSAGCPARTTNYYAYVKGPGTAYATASDGRGASLVPPTDVNISRTGPFPVQFTPSFADAAASVGTHIVAGTYDVTLTCADDLGHILGTFTTTIYFTDATHYHTATAAPGAGPSPSVSGVPTPMPSQPSTVVPDDGGPVDTATVGGPPAPGAATGVTIVVLLLVGVAGAGGYLWRGRRRRVVAAPALGKGVVAPVLPPKATVHDDVSRPASALRITSTALTILAAVAVGLVIQLAVLGGVQHHRAQAVEYAQFRDTMALGTTPVGGVGVDGRLVAPGTPIAILDIPRIRLWEVVGEGTTSSVLTAGPGHRRDTVLPGQVGTSVLMGRRAGYGGPFSRIDELVGGDKILVLTAQGTQHFSVLDVRHAGDPEPEDPLPGQGRLTLVTADGPAFAPTDVVRVDADLDSPVQPTPRLALGSAQLSPAEAAMSGDDTAYFPLILWGQLLAAAAVGVVWLRHRVGRWQAWMIGVQVLGSLGLVVANAAIRLLPNLL